MIPEYKLYHGAVLADIVDKFDGAVSFREVVDAGRLLNYVVNDRVGLQIKYATARLRPWHFTFPSESIDQIKMLVDYYPVTFVSLVCHTDGFASIPACDLITFLENQEIGQGWLRIDRRKREMYRVYGPNGEFPCKFRTTGKPIVEALRQSRLEDRYIKSATAERLPGLVRSGA